MIPPARRRLRATFARLVAVSALVFLLTSRTMLLVHELGGHGAPAVLFGGRVTGWYLFLFAGGRVSYEITSNLAIAKRLVISLGGIGLELAFGAAALVLARRLARRSPFAAFCLLAAGTVVVGHGAVYFARGVHYGFGDGALLARLLGDVRVVAVVAASAVAVLATYFGGRRLATMPLAALGGPPWRVAGVLVLAFACGGLVHGALAYCEIRWFPDPAWVAIMEDASVARARAELAQRLAEAKRRGETPPSDDEKARMLERLEHAARPWPLDPVLALGIVGGLFVGLLRGARGAKEQRDEASRPSLRALLGLAGALLFSVLVILALRRASPSAESPQSGELEEKSSRE